MVIDKIKEIIYSGDKCISTRLSPEYFSKIGKMNIYEEFMLETTQFPEDTSIIDRIWYLENDMTEPQKCKVCGKFTKIDKDRSKMHWKPRIYCCKECQSNDPDLSNIMKNRKTKVDETSALEKRKHTMMAKYGVETNSQRPEIREILSNNMSARYLSIEQRLKLDDIEWLKQNYVIEGKSASDIACELGVYYGTVIDYLTKYDISIRKSSTYHNSRDEKELQEYISSLDIESLNNHTDYEKFGKKYELDVFVPSKMLGFEMNGVQWHSDTKPDKHLSKTLFFKEFGIGVMHIDSYSWNMKKPIWMSYIKNMLVGTKNKIYARNCSIVEVPSKEAKTFFETTHLQGHAFASIYLGLMYEGNLVCCMSFVKSRFNKKFDYELLRFSSLLDMTVVGGFSKLLKNFRKNNTGSIISYCDFSRSNGNVYLKNGFTYIGRSKPGYYWVKNDVMYNRENFMKHKLSTKLSDFRPDESERENMIRHNFRQYWDCGQLIFGYE